MANSDKLFKSFTCPIGNCGENIIEDPAKISEHLRHSHRGTSMQMNLYQDPRNVAFFCHHCNRYLRRLHFHCTECEKTHAVTNQTVNTFPNKKALDEHRITHPEKWFLERCCNHINQDNGKRIITCHGWKSGACGFNHMHHENNFVMSDALPSWLCRYENLKENTRCQRAKCSFEHLRGHVSFIIKKAAEAAGAAAEAADKAVETEGAMEEYGGTAAKAADKVVKTKGTIAEAASAEENTSAADRVAPSTPERRSSGKCPDAPKKKRNERK